MAVPTTLVDLSTTAASNSPAGSDSIGASLDDYLRSIQAIIKQQFVKGSDIASAATITPASDGSYYSITGTTGVTAIGSTYSWNGRMIVLKFAGAVLLTHNGSTLILPGSVNITTVAGDVIAFVQEGAGVWRCAYYQPSGGNITSAAIGVTVQAYDANTAKLNVAQAFTKVQSCNSATATQSTTTSFTFDPSTHGQDCEITLTNAITVTLTAAAGKIVAGTYYTLTFKAGDTSARSFAKGATVLAPAATLPIVSGSVTTGGRDVFHLRGVDANTVMVVGVSADVR